MKSSNFLALFAGVFVLTVCGLLFAAPATEKKSSFTEQQKSDIQLVVKEYLIENPEVLVEVSKALQEKTRKLQEEQAKEIVAASFDEFVNSTNPTLGNPEGTVALVEFLDYQCGHCKEMHQVVSQLISDNPNLKVIVKELPIFGPESDLAAKAAIASHNQGKFAEFHANVLKQPKKLSKDLIFEIGKQSGLDVNQLKVDLENPKIAEELAAVRELATKLGIQGTPFFLIVNLSEPKDIKMAILPGAGSKESIKELIDQVSEKV